MGKLYDEIMEMVRLRAVEMPVVYGNGEKSTAKYVPLEEVGMVLAMLEDGTNRDMVRTVFLEHDADAIESALEGYEVGNWLNESY